MGCRSQGDSTFGNRHKFEHWPAQVRSCPWRSDDDTGCENKIFRKAAGTDRCGIATPKLLT
ncbi:hypothetical protein ACG33_01560 [Steroidobacter denitrificans]|uniref:Uncharacterized protein n=1 Tax=Steroidobacter denitrificans TaxID=465721 RepID=A0A127F5V0_STEDE|nr:hypothetical protein ACG33_01560 [Steroidobacter denitrificans]